MRNGYCQRHECEDWLLPVPWVVSKGKGMC